MRPCPNSRSEALCLQKPQRFQREKKNNLETSSSARPSGHIEHVAAVSVLLSLPSSSACCSHHCRGVSRTEAGHRGALRDRPHPSLEPLLWLQHGRAPRILLLHPLPAQARTTLTPCFIGGSNSRSARGGRCQEHKYRRTDSVRWERIPQARINRVPLLHACCVAARCPHTQ